MTQATFYKWVIDCPNNVPQELIDYIIANNELIDLSIDIDFITFETYERTFDSTKILFEILEKVLLDSDVDYYIQATEFTTTGECLYSASEDYEEFDN